MSHLCQNGRESPLLRAVAAPDNRAGAGSVQDVHVAEQAEGAGCTVVLKPAEQTPLTAILLAEALDLPETPSRLECSHPTTTG